MEAPKPSWAALLQQPSDPREVDFSSSPALPLSNISLYCHLSGQCFVLPSAQKLSCWGASPSAVEERTFRNKKKGLVTIARHIAWIPQFLATRRCEMCWHDALRMHCTTSYWSGLSVVLLHLKRNHQITKCCSWPAPTPAPFFCCLKNFLQKSAGYQWAANIKIESGTFISFPAKGIWTIYGKCSAIEKWHN